MADTTSDEVASSPFDVDLGGEQRRELRSQLRMANIQLANARDDRALMQAQIEALQRLERESKARAMISGHRRQSVAAAYSGWARSVAVSKSQRALAKLGDDAKGKAAALQEKETQVAALVDRVGRVKAKAQSKLSELHDANQQLAAALSQRDGELKAAKTALKQFTAEGGLLRVAQCERDVALRALSSVDGELKAAHQQLAKEAAHAEMQAALIEGLSAEAACNRLEQKLGAGTFAIGEPIVLAMATQGGLIGAPPSSSGSGEGGTAGGGMTSMLRVAAESVELCRCRRALLGCVFHGWKDRVTLFRSLRGESSEWVVKVDEAKAEVARLSEALFTSEALAEVRKVEIERLSAQLQSEQAAASSASAAASASLAEAQVELDVATAESCATEALLRGCLASREDECARLAAVAERRAEELLRGEEVLQTLARAHRDAYIGSPVGRMTTRSKARGGGGA